MSKKTKRSKGTLSSKTGQETSKGVSLGNLPVTEDKPKEIVLGANVEAVMILAAMAAQKAKLVKIAITSLIALAKKWAKWNPGQRSPSDYLTIYPTVKAGGINTPPWVEMREGKVYRLLRGFVRVDALMHLINEYPGKLKKLYPDGTIMVAALDLEGRDEVALAVARDHGQVVTRPKYVITRQLVVMAREGKSEMEICAIAANDLLLFSKPSKIEELKTELSQGAEINPETSKPNMSPEEVSARLFKFHRGTLQKITKLANLPDRVMECVLRHEAGDDTGPRLKMDAASRIYKANKASPNREKLTAEAEVMFEEEKANYGRKVEREFAPLTPTEAEEFVKQVTNPVGRAVVLRLHAGVDVPKFQEVNAEVQSLIDRGILKLPAEYVEALEAYDRRMMEIAAEKEAKIAAKKAKKEAKASA